MHTPLPPPHDSTLRQKQPADSTNDVENSDDSKVPKIFQAISITAVGIVALFSYFFHIEYFPLFDLQAASSYLLAVTWVLVVLLLLFAVILLVPYFIIGTTLKIHKTPTRDHRQSIKIYFWMGFSMLSLIIVSAGMLLAFWMKWNFIWGLVIGLLCSLLLCVARARLYLKNIKKKYSRMTVPPWRKKTVWMLFVTMLGNSLLVSILQLLPLSILLLMISRASGLAQDDYFALFFVIALCAFLTAIPGGMVLHVVFIPRYRKRWRIALCLVLALPVALSGFSNATGMLPMTMARLTKIGNFRADKLVLSPKACGSIAPLLGVECDEKTSPPLQLCNVHVMSRVGPETYLRIADKKAGKNGKFPVRRIFVPTADIMAMQVNFDIQSLRLNLIDDDLGGRSSTCGTTLTTLRGDSAFDFDDFTLTESGKTQLLSFAQEIKNGASVIQEVKVTGHADKIGQPQRNTWLSARRAKEVKLFLEKQLKNMTLEVKIIDSSQGSTQPLVNDCGALAALKERIKCEAPNRRVELEIIRKTPDKSL